jgi:cytochrome c
MTITINIDYFEKTGVTCPHCKQTQLTTDNIIDRLTLAGRRVYRMECSFCHSNSTIQEKADETQTQERTYSYHRPKYRR